MPAYNRCIFIGNLTRDPELRYVKNGDSSVCKFTLAVNHKGAEKLFLDVEAWHNLALAANHYLIKGGSALVEGRLVIRKYDGKDGAKRTATELVASDIRFLGGLGVEEDTSLAADEQTNDDLVPF